MSVNSIANKKVIYDNVGSDTIEQPSDTSTSKNGLQHYTAEPGRTTYATFDASISLVR